MDKLEDMAPDDMRIDVLTEVLAHSYAIRTLLAPLVMLEERRVRQQQIRDARKRKATPAATKVA